MAEIFDFDEADPFLARAAWSRLSEPGDEVACSLVEQLGPSESLRWVAGAVRRPESISVPAGISSRRPSSGPEPLPVGAVLRLRRALARWAPRFEGLDPRRELSVLSRLGGRLLIPEEDGWPAPLTDLGLAAPLCLWIRGPAAVDQAARRSIAIVGARACTEYGQRVAEDLAVGLADRHFTVVSGGAYGIDAAAHRGALAAPGPTIAFLAGGVDRLYPTGNTALLEEIIDKGGAVVSEVPPGSAPYRARFLLRNRLIAAFSSATVVVEAAWRSGSLSTAARATELLRPVGAVPGPVTSMASAGCHRLLREAAAVCVTDADEAAALAGTPGDVEPSQSTPPRPTDALDPTARTLWDALPARSGASVESIARAAGLSVDEVLGGLGHLELMGVAERRGGGWRKAGGTG